jgi:hypothetical protein
MITDTQIPQYRAAYHEHNKNPQQRHTVGKAAGYIPYGRGSILFLGGGGEFGIFLGL